MATKPKPMGLVGEETQLDGQEQAEQLSGPAPTAEKLRGAARPEDLKQKRVKYPRKDKKGTVESLSKADRATRTSHSKILMLCPTHHVPCETGTSGSSEGILTRLYCPVEGCNFSDKLVKPTVAEQMTKFLRPTQQKSGPAAGR